MPILAANANHRAFAAALQANHIGSHAQAAGKEHRRRPVSNAQQGRRRSFRREPRRRWRPARSDSLSRARIVIMTGIVIEIDVMEIRNLRPASAGRAAGRSRSSIPGSRRSAIPSRRSSDATACHTSCRVAGVGGVRDASADSPGESSAERPARRKEHHTIPKKNRRRAQMDRVIKVSLLALSLLAHGVD